MTVAIVTGASSGIGEAVAHRLAREGVCVTLAARRQDQLERVAAEIAALGGQSLCAPTDVRDHASIQRLAQTTVDRWGRVDVLVNNAGLGYPAQVAQLDLARVRELIDVNLIAVIACSQAVLPVMQRQKSGHIINIASVAGLIGLPGASIYCATKSAVGGFSEALRREVRQHGVHVSVLYPGFVATNFNAQLARAAEKQKNGQRVRGVVSADYVAERVADLLRRPRRQVIIPPTMQIIVACLQAWPGLADVFLSRYYTRLKASL